MRNAKRLLGPPELKHTYALCIFKILFALQKKKKNCYSRNKGHECKDRKGASSLGIKKQQERE